MDSSGYLILWAIICGLIAKEQNRSVGWGIFWGLFAGFFVFIVYLLIGKKEDIY